MSGRDFQGAHTSLADDGKAPGDDVTALAQKQAAAAETNTNTESWCLVGSSPKNLTAVKHRCPDSKVLTVEARG